MSILHKLTCVQSKWSAILRRLLPDPHFLRRAALAILAGVAVFLVMVGGGWYALYFLWQNSQEVKSGVFILSMIPVLGLVLLAPPLMVVGLSFASGIAACRMLWPSPSSAVVAPELIALVADAVAEAMAQNRSGSAVNTRCPVCNGTIVLQPSSGPEERLRLSCKCGACSGQVPA